MYVCLPGDHCASLLLNAVVSCGMCGPRGPLPCDELRKRSLHPCSLARIWKNSSELWLGVSLKAGRVWLSDLNINYWSIEERSSQTSCIWELLDACKRIMTENCLGAFDNNIINAWISTINWMFTIWQALSYIILFHASDSICHSAIIRFQFEK